MLSARMRRASCGVQGPGALHVRVLSFTTGSHGASTTRTRSNDGASVRFDIRDGYADAPYGTLGPSHGYFGLVRGAPYSPTYLMSPFSLLSRFSGQLSVLSLCGRNVKHILQPFLRLHISIWCTSVIEGIITYSLYCGICCWSFRAFLQTSIC